MKVTKDWLKKLAQAKVLTVGVNGDRYATLHFETRCKATNESLSTFFNYPEPLSKDDIILPDKYTKAHAHIYLTYSGLGYSLKSLLRDGDELRFRFARNDNGYLEACQVVGNRLSGSYREDYDRLYHDTCLVTIRRKNKYILHDAQIGDSVCPDNSARMLQY